MYEQINLITSFNQALFLGFYLCQTHVICPFLILLVAHENQFIISAMQPTGFPTWGRKQWMTGFPTWGRKQWMAGFPIPGVGSSG